jgi:SAM-dependent methyltransferase
MSVSGGRSSLRATARGVVGRSLRASPPAVRDTARRGSRAILRALGDGSTVADPSAWQTPQVPLPAGLSLEQLERVWRSWSINGEPVGHMDDYVADSKLRFLYTWSLLQGEKGRCLELGASPYFATWLLENYTGLDLSLANYFGVSGEQSDTLSWLPLDASERVEKQQHFRSFNVEEERFPYDDASFEVVVFCEMIEHLLMDPVAALREIRRILKPGGLLLLTTPNVARLENVIRLAEGRNIYDPYSGYGPYGRHNREYTARELQRLLKFTGFDVETTMTADGHYTDNTVWDLYEGAAKLVQYRRADLGHYLYLTARAGRPARDGLPSFLYRSRPAGEIVPYE